MSPSRPAPAATTLSTKRQVVLPSGVCRRRGWSPGTRLTVEDTPDGVLLKAARLFPETSWEEVFEIGRRGGPSVPVEALNFDPNP